MGGVKKTHSPLTSGKHPAPKSITEGLLYPCQVRLRRRRDVAIGVIAIAS